MNLAFIVTAYQESSEAVDRCLHNIRKAYPVESIALISDGGSSFADVAEKHCCLYIHGERLKDINRGGEWWKRFFETSQMVDTDYTFKLDVDTYVSRQFKFFPEADVFGTLQNDKAIQGGLQGFSRLAIKKVLESEICNHPFLQDPKVWTNKLSHVIQYVNDTHEVCLDYMLKYIIESLGLTRANWSEVYCTWHGTIPTNRDLAAFHPVK